LNDENKKKTSLTYGSEAIRVLKTTFMWLLMFLFQWLLFLMSQVVDRMVCLIETIINDDLALFANQKKPSF
jgi:hypothetical protein